MPHAETPAEASGVRPLNILIAGAGIGGLAAAVGLRQQGHHVTLFEKSRLNKEIGAAMFIAPNCCGILHHWGIDPVENGSVELHGMNMHDAAGNLRNSLDTREAYKHVPHTWEMMHRAHVHNALKQKALSPEGPGAPATLHVHSEILSADPTNATITTADGRVHQGDLIIGADGVHSKIRNSIPGCTQQPFDSGKNAFRSLIPMSKIAADPVASSILKDADHYFQLWAGPDRSVIMYPCASNTQMNVALVHPSPRTDRPHDAADHWQRPASKAEMLEVARDFDPRVLAVLELADEAELKRWTLLDLEKVPRFTHERLVLVGDAAHPFLPYQGQGGAQAIEDGASIAAVLPAGTRPSDLPSRLEIYEAQRYHRAHRIQDMTRHMGKDHVPGAQPPNYHEFMEYNINHDEWIASREALRRKKEEAVEAEEGGKRRINGAEVIAAAA